MATIDWTPVEEAEAEKTLAGYKVALIEATKILEQRLREERVPGRTGSERLAAAHLHLTKPAAAEKAHSYVMNLRHGHTGGLTMERAKIYLQSLRQAVADLNDLSQARDSFIAQLKLYVGLLRGRQRWLVRLLFGLAGFLVLVLFLADTTPGQVLVTGIVTGVHLFFSAILLLLLVIALSVLAVLGTAIYLDRQGRGRIKEEDEE